MQSLSDEKLMKKYAEGHATAFDILYTRHRAPVFRYLLRHMGNQNASVEELYQDVWASIIKNRHSYVESAKFTTYIYKIAHHKMVDYFRRSSVRQEFQNESVDDDQTEEFIEPQQQIHWKNCIEQLLGLVKNLPVEQREAFILRHEGNNNIDAIAEITGVNPQTAKSRLRYAMQKLRDSLSDDCL